MNSPAQETRFSIRDVLKVFTFVIFLFAFFVGVFQLVPEAAGVLDGFHPSIAFLITYLIQFLVLFFPLWVFVVDKYGANAADFGLMKTPFWRMMKIVVLCYLVYLLFSLALNVVFIYTGWEVPGYQDQESYLPLFGYDLLGYLSAVIVVAIIGPFLEEIFFRGFVYRVFTKTWPLWLGSVLSALLFALIHFQLQTLLPLFLLGLILNFAYQKTGSIWTSFVFHSLNNSLAFGLDLYLYFHPEILEQLEAVTAFLYN